MNADQQVNRRIQAFLAVAVTLGFFGTITALMFGHEISASVKDILLVLLGALIASFKDIMGYFFGSSSSSQRKDETIAAQAATAAAPPNPAFPLAASGAPDDPIAVHEVKAVDVDLTK